MGPPGGERFGVMARLTRPINIVTNGVVGSLSTMRVNLHRRPEATVRMWHMEPQRPFIGEDMLPGPARRSQG
jgi:hypothetical protein